MTEQLAPYYEAAAEEAKTYEEHEPLAELERAIEGVSPAQFRTALITQPDVAVIAEHKRRSPSEGDIRPDSDIHWVVDQYRQAGAAALSILTQRTHFGGHPNDLISARSSVDLPILRKDFISTEYQLYQARANCADAALLIVAGLSDARLQALYREAGNIGLDRLVEVHDEAELERAMALEPDMIGINNRNLATLQVDLDTTRSLIDKVPGHVTTVAESGYSVRKLEHIAELRELGVDAVLMGTALMREDHPAEALSTWINS